MQRDRSLSFSRISGKEAWLERLESSVKRERILFAPDYDVVHDDTVVHSTRDIYGNVAVQWTTWDLLGRYALLSRRTQYYDAAYAVRLLILAPIL